MSDTSTVVTQVGDQSTVADQGKLAIPQDSPPERGSVRENFKLSAAPSSD